MNSQKENLDEIKRKLNVLDCLMSDYHNYPEEYDNIKDSETPENN